MYYIDEGRPSLFRLYAPDGRVLLATDVQVPGNPAPHLTGLAIDTDGTIAVSYFDASNVNRGGIEFLDSTGERTGAIDTQHYLPGNLCYAEDHLLWSFGGQQDKDNPGRRDRQDSLRRERDGKTLRLSVLDRASSAWKDVEAAMEGGLYGADGDELVFAGWGHGPMHLRWFKQPATPPSPTLLAPATTQ